MNFIKVLERRWQLRQHGPGIAPVHAADVVALEGVHEALGHAVALRAAHRRVDGLQAQLPSQAAGVIDDVLRRQKNIVSITTEDLHRLEREFGFSYPASFYERLPELLALCETEPFATAFPATHLLLSTSQVKLAQEKCDDSLLPFMLGKEVSEDIYAFDLRSQGPEYDVVVWAVHTTVRKWSGFAEFLVWLRQQCRC